MGKISSVIKTEFQRQLTYRVNFFAFRVASIIEILAQIAVWSAIYRETPVIRGYTYPEMMTYILVGWFFAYFTANYSFEHIVSRHIQDGTLSAFLAKPFQYLSYVTWLSIGRITIALSSAVIMQVLFSIVFFKFLIFSFHPLSLVIIAAMLIAGYFIKLATSILMSLLAFWFTEIDGVHYCINTLVKFLSGTYFPLNILPAAFFRASLWTPFIYTFYIPTQLYLGKITIADGLRGLGIELLWLFVIYAILLLVWRVGLRRYEGVGI